MAGFNSDAYTSVLPWMSLAARLKSNIEHVDIIILAKEEERYIWHRSNIVTDPVRRQVEEILGSPSLKSVTLRIDPQLNSASFPQWLFQSISLSVTKVSISSSHISQTNDHGSLPADTEVHPLRSLSGANVHRQSLPQRYLEEFSLVLADPKAKIDPWATWLAGPCFNLDLTRTKKLTISHQSQDDTPWRLADEASLHLEGLAVIHRSGAFLLCLSFPRIL